MDPDTDDTPSGPDVVMPGDDTNLGATWSKRLGSGESDAASEIAFDAASNMFVAGTFRGILSVGNSEVQSAGETDIFLAKIAPAGAIVWLRRIGSVNSDTVSGLAISADGDVVIVGGFSGSCDFGGGALAAHGPLDMYIAKYSGRDGAYRWSERFGGDYSDQAKAVAIDKNDHILITGAFSGTVDFGGGPFTVPYVSDLDVFLLKLDANGKHVWSRRFDNTGNEIGYGIAVDGAGNITIVGSFLNEMSFGGASLVSPNAKTDAFVAHFNSAGEHVWSRDFGSDGENEGAYGVAADAQGDVAILGYGSAAIDLGGGSLAARGYTDCWLVKLAASDGAHRFSHRLGGNRADMPAALAFDGAGHLFASGYFGGTGDFGGTLTAADDQDMFVVEYGTDGGYLAGHALGGVGQDNPAGMALAPSGQIGVVGFFFGQAAAYPGAVLQSAGMADAVIVRMSM
jgi:hypothetical protein